jgi:hypothetical protein
MYNRLKTALRYIRTIHCAPSNSKRTRPVFYLIGGAEELRVIVTIVTSVTVIAIRKHIHVLLAS